MDALLDCQDEAGRISTYSPAQEFQGWDLWCRKYVLLGLWHFHQICQDVRQKQRIEQSVCRQLDYIEAHIGAGVNQKKSPARQRLAGYQFQLILEPVVRWYRVLMRPCDLAFADYIVANGGADSFNIFEAAYEDKLYPYEYPVVKAYELMSCFEGLGEYADVTGSDKWRITLSVCGEAASIRTDNCWRFRLQEGAVQSFFAHADG